MTLIKHDSPVEALYNTKRWDRFRRLVIDRAGGRCERCGKMITERFIIHHMKPATRENFFDLDNLQLLCLECHNTVTFVENVKRKDSEIYSVKDNVVGNLIDFD